VRSAEQLKRFYAYHFIPVNPPDFRLTPISRTVGTDTIVDEFIVHFTHTTLTDWLLPGIPPHKVADKSLPSTRLMERWQESEGKRV
jgi:hypothetical protein